MCIDLISKCNHFYSQNKSQSALLPGFTSHSSHQIKKTVHVTAPHFCSRKTSQSALRPGFSSHSGQQTQGLSTQLLTISTAPKPSQSGLLPCFQSHSSPHDCSPFQQPKLFAKRAAFLEVAAGSPDVAGVTEHASQEERGLQELLQLQPHRVIPVAVAYTEVCTQHSAFHFGSLSGTGIVLKAVAHMAVCTQHRQKHRVPFILDHFQA